jgi:hypothetical protein
MTSDGSTSSSTATTNPKVVAPPSANTYPLVQPKASSEFGRRIALVIGNATYKNAPVLSNPQRDAILVADALKRTGFQSVTLQIDLGRDALVSALRNFAG